jgi:hypothetical protein
MPKKYVRKGGTMKLSILYLLIISFHLQARSPAVEDFVGIDTPEIEESIPSGVHVLYNFQKELVDAQGEKSPYPAPEVVLRRADAPKTSTTNSQASNQQTNTSLGFWFGISTILALPLMTWFLTMRHLGKETSIASSNEKIQTYDNVTPLPLAKKSSSLEKTISDKEQDEDYKKAS